MQVVAVNTLKAKLSQYLNALQENDEPIYITKRGKIIACLQRSDPKSIKASIENELAGTLLYYKDPTEPVGEEDWEALSDHS